MSDTLTVVQAALGDLEPELEKTREFLERIDDQHFDWKPHEKSWSMGELGGHMANAVSWQALMLQTEGYDMAGSDPGDWPAPTSRDGILELWDENVKSVREAVAGITADELSREWTFRNGDQVIFSQPRAHAFRAFGISHLVHHRAQLGVYLRMLDIPVPGAYGPSADEQMGDGEGDDEA